MKLAREERLKLVWKTINKDHILYYFKFCFLPSFFNYWPFKQILLGEKKV